MYQLTIVVFTLLGLLLSAFFVLTWTPFAFRTLYRHTLPARFSALEVIDITGLPLGIFVLYLLSVLNLLTVGVQPAPTVGVAVARVLSVVIFDVIVGLRAYRWARILLGGPATAQDRHDAYSEHYSASEGTHGSTSTD